MEEENVRDIGAEAPAEDAQRKFGKFKDADALMKAYEELEAEFTRRSQRLKALEKSKAQEPSAEPAKSAGPAEEGPSPSFGGKAESGGETLVRTVVESGETRAEAADLRLPRGVSLMTKGTGVVAPAQKPKTFAEAGSLALGYLRNKK